MTTTNLTSQTRTAEQIAADAAAKAARRKAMVEQRLARRTKEIGDEIEAAAAQMTKARLSLEALPEAIARTMDMVDRLEAAGFTPQVGYWSESIYIETTRKDLPRLCHVLQSSLDGSKQTRSAVHDDLRKTDVRISMPVRKFPWITVSYVTKVPRKGKCKLVKRTSSYVTLVCES